MHRSILQATSWNGTRLGHPAHQTMPASAPMTTVLRLLFISSQLSSKRHFYPPAVAAATHSVSSNNSNGGINSPEFSFLLTEPQRHCIGQLAPHTSIYPCNKLIPILTMLLQRETKQFTIFHLIINTLSNMSPSFELFHSR